MRHVVPAIGGDPIRVQATLWFRLGRWAILAVTLLLGWLVVTQAAQSLRHSEAFMGDFIYSFYPAVRYWLDGLNPYLGQYINASNGVYAPIYNPPWLLPVLIPIDMWPLDNAIVMWLSLNCILLIALARSALLWAHAPLRAGMVVLLLAPWNYIGLMGQISLLPALGIVVTYVGFRRRQSVLLAGGLILTTLKPHLGVFVLALAAILLLRLKLTARVAASTFVLVMLSTLLVPTWPLDLTSLTLQRITTSNPPMERPYFALGDWVPDAAILVGVCILLLALWKPRTLGLNPGLWSALVTLGLIFSPHSFTYDWVLLLIPFAYLWQSARYRLVVIGLYLLPFLWLALGRPPWLAQTWVLIGCLAASIVRWALSSETNHEFGILLPS